MAGDFLDVFPGDARVEDGEEGQDADDVADAHDVADGVGVSGRGVCVCGCMYAGVRIYLIKMRIVCVCVYVCAYSK